MFLSTFSTTDACNALIQSPCRLISYQQQRRRLYQDTGDDVSGANALSSTLSLPAETPKLGML